MAVIRANENPIGVGNRPEWSRVTSAGVFRLSAEGARADRHFHDCDEYWLIYAGKAKILCEGREEYVRAGDIVCTEAGQEHDVLEVYEAVEGFWFEDRLREGGRAGHLHRSPELAKGHPVPFLPLPDDFPL